MVDLPNASTNQLLIVGGVFLGLLILAVFMELYRQRRERARRTAAAWRTIDDIASDKKLTEEEHDVLCALIRKWEPDDPLRAATVRHHFDKCVDLQMDELRRRDEKRYSEMGLRLRDIRVALGLDYIPVGQRISSTRELFGGQIIWLAETSGGSLNWFKGRVVAVDEAYFCVVPEDENEGPKRRSVNPGDEFRCKTWRDDDARYNFAVDFAQWEEEPASMAFYHTSDLRRLQSRAYFRVRHDQGTSVQVLTRPVDDDFSNMAERRVVTKLRGRITNLSAGGCALVLQESLPRQVLLRMVIELDGCEPFDVVGDMVDVSPVSGGRYLVRTSFVVIDDDARDKIARYVVRRQQPLLHSGVGVES